jgi:hypothetical protein
MKRAHIIHDAAGRLLIFSLMFTVACSAAPASVPPTPATVVTPTPAADAPLIPDGLYVLERGQIARITADGRDRTLITEEPEAIAGYPAISGFDLFSDGSLIYTAVDPRGTRLMLQRGGAAATQVFLQPNILLEDPIWQPDGAAAIVYLRDASETQQIVSGIYRIMLADGSLQLIRQDPQQRDGSTLPNRTVRAVSANRDGSLWLVHERDEGQSLCRPALLTAAGELIRPVEQAGVTLFCGEERWTAAGDAVLISGGPADGPGIMRLAGDGSLELLTPAGVAGRAATELADGRLAFVAVTRADDGWQFQLSELNRDGSVTARGDAFAALPLYISWTADGSGALLVVNDNGQRSVRYVARSGGSWRPIAETPDGIAGLRWLPQP